MQALRRPARARAWLVDPGQDLRKRRIGQDRRDGGRDRRAQYVLGAIGTPCADKARQIGTTPKRSRWASMNA